MAPTGVFVVAALYLGIAAASVTHEDLLMGAKVVLPVLGAGVPIAGPFGFCWIGPLLLFGLHVSLLLRQFVVAQVAREEGLLGEADDPTFALTFPAAGTPRSLPRKKVRYAIKGSFLVSFGALPLAVLLAFQVFFLPYHGVWVTRWHQGLILLDLVVIWYFVGRMTTGSLIWRQSFWVRGGRGRLWWLLLPVLFVVKRPIKTLGALVSLILVYFVLYVAVIPDTGLDRLWGKAYWPDKLRVDRNLDLRGATLVRSPPDPELLAFELERADSLGQGGDSEEAVFDAWRRHSQGLNLSGRNLRDADLSGARLYRAVLKDADLRGARLAGAHLEGADLASGPKGTRLDGADLRNAFLRETDLTDASLVRADLSGARGEGAVFRGAVLQDARVQDATLHGSDAQGARLDGADLTGASLRRSRLDDASLTGAIFTGADLSNASLRSADLRGAILSDAEAHDAELPLARTLGAVFRSAHLEGTLGLETPGVDLNGARLTGADLGWGGPAAARLPVPSLTDLRGVQGLLRLPSSTGPVLHDGPAVFPGAEDLPSSALPRAFFDELARELVRSACGELSKPQLMESLLRRSAGCFGPREPLLEEALRSGLIEAVAEERQGLDGPTWTEAGAAAPRPSSCAVLGGFPEHLLEALELAEDGRDLLEPGEAAFRAPYALCAPGPLLPREEPEER